MKSGTCQASQSKVCLPLFWRGRDEMRGGVLFCSPEWLLLESASVGTTGGRHLPCSDGGSWPPCCLRQAVVLPDLLFRFFSQLPFLSVSKDKTVPLQFCCGMGLRFLYLPCIKSRSVVNTGVDPESMCCAHWIEEKHSIMYREPHGRWE